MKRISVLTIGFAVFAFSAVSAENPVPTPEGTTPETTADSTPKTDEVATSASSEVAISPASESEATTTTEEATTENVKKPVVTSKKATGKKGTGKKLRTAAAEETKKLNDVPFVAPEAAPATVTPATTEQGAPTEEATKVVEEEAMTKSKEVKAGEPIKEEGGTVEEVKTTETK
ncbi:MAG: hypothetical protein LBI26_01915 [Holosporales bacterium]|jgi:hypothetical protein|nr:hypothetical protein [Holosporales bacterium]